ncbi:conserved hypothetical protein [Echinococcus multilocularis]|uniref:Uncharacterized protein n=1 Tax=Echinococcus multilocularis TaxID=6211 RepID=A0A068XZZ1_ECHMU|nr:conserved hypothetical protein [Echinococcus multilocularis]
MKVEDFTGKILAVKEEFLRIAELVHDDVQSVSQFFDSFFVESVLSLNPPSGSKPDLTEKTGESPAHRSEPNRGKPMSEIADSDPVEDNEETLVRLINEMSIDELKFLKNQLLLELDWLDQAITSRKQFLRSVFNSEVQYQHGILKRGFTTTK